MQPALVERVKSQLTNRFPVSVRQAQYYYKSTSSLSRVPFSDWLLTLYDVIDSEQRCSVSLLKKMTVASWRFQSVCEEDLDKRFERPNSKK